MAFQKFANANIIRPDIHTPAWDKLCEKALAAGAAFTTRQASRIALTEYTPREFMLSHCTIVASVDTEEGPGPLGRHLEGSQHINRMYSDYLVTPETSQYINNNNDGWERSLLLSCFRTFIGGENYVEHLQIPEMSKGKIIDAVARDIGDSIYIDILVATNRKHTPLIAAIRDRKLQTLSMGCNVAFTVCTKCGNVAQDETELCPHIKYEKGNTFIDHLGKTRKVAELCGHSKAEPGSVKFIEASWVANPAFTGAVLRDILTPEEMHLHAPAIHAAFSFPARTADPNLMARAANMSTPKAFDYGQGSQEQFEGAGAPTPKKEADPLDDAVEDLASYIRNKAVEKLRSQMSGTPSSADLKENTNDTLIRQASQNPFWKKLALTVNQSTKDPQKTRRVLLGMLHYRRGGWKAVQASGGFTGREILAISRVLDTVQGVPRIAGEARLYRTVLAVGGSAPYEDEAAYLTACRRVLGRQPTESEKQVLVVKGKLFDLGL